MAQQLTFDLTTNETFTVKVKLRKDFESTISLIKEFLAEKNPNTEITNDVIFEKALTALSLHPDLKKFSQKSGETSNTKNKSAAKKIVEASKESA